MASKKRVEKIKSQANLQKNSKTQEKQSAREKNNLNINKMDHQIWKSYLPAVAFIAACVLIFYPPYFKGLFMNPALYITHTLTAIILILVAVSLNREDKISWLQTPLDWAALAFAFAYLISLFDAVHPGDAFFGFIKTLNYLAIYWIVSRIVRSWTQMETMLRVLVASGTGVAAIGILASMGYSAYPHAMYGGTIVSTLQYSNTTATFLAAMVILAVGLWNREKNSFMQLIYLTISSLMTLVILNTSSKGAWLAFLMGGIVLWSVVPKGYRFKTTYGFVVMFIAAAACYIKFFPTINGEGGEAKWLLICLLLSFAGVVLWQFANKLLEDKSYKTLIILIAVIVTISIIPIGMLSQQVLQNSDLVTEAKELLDLENSSYYGRISFNNWAWEIIKDYPINGTGAGGWAALYHQYQDNNAITTEVHNYYLQTWIEAGTIGILSLIFVITIALWCLYRMRSYIEEQEWILMAGVTGAIIVLLSHAAIDFDLSIPAMAIFVWILLGLINSGYQKSADTNPFPVISSPIINKSILILVSLILIISGTLFYAAYRHADMGTTHMRIATTPNLEENAQQNRLQKARQEIQKAIHLNPMNAEYQAAWAAVNAISYNKSKDQNSEEAILYYNNAVEGITRGEYLQPYYAKNRQKLLESSVLLGNGDLILKQTEGLLKANPNDIKAYITLVNILWEAFQYSLNANNQEAASEYAKQLISVEERLQLQINRINPNLPWYGAPLQFPEQTEIKIQLAKDYLGD